VSLAAAHSPTAIGRIINVGSGRELSINDLVKKLEGLLGTSLPVVHSPAQTGGVSRAQADIRRAREILGFHPRVSIEEGLERMVALYPESRAASHSAG
jgi:nucleoside-diphosphate-sugar epimerase